MLVLLPLPTPTLHTHTYPALPQAYFFGYVVHRLLLVALGRREEDDRDHYGNKVRPRVASYGRATRWGLSVRAARGGRPLSPRQQDGCGNRRGRWGTVGRREVPAGVEECWLLGAWTGLERRRRLSVGSPHHPTLKPHHLPSRPRVQRLDLGGPLLANLFRQLFR